MSFFFYSGDVFHWRASSWRFCFIFVFFWAHNLCSFSHWFVAFHFWLYSAFSIFRNFAPLSYELQTLRIFHFDYGVLLADKKNLYLLSWLLDLLSYLQKPLNFKIVPEFHPYLWYFYHSYFLNIEFVLIYGFNYRFIFFPEWL